MKDKVTWSATASNGGTVEGYVTISEYEWIDEINYEAILGKYLCVNLEVGVTSPGSTLIVSPMNFAAIQANGAYPYTPSVPDGKERLPTKATRTGESQTGWNCFDVPHEETQVALLLEEGKAATLIDVPAS